MHPNDTVLNDYVDGTLGAQERTEVEAHVASCAVCRSLVDDLRDITRSAASLEQREPPARAWARIERAIELEGEGARWRGPFRPAIAAPKAPRHLAWLAAAAAIIIAAVVGLRYAPSRATPASNAPGGSAVNVTSQTIEAELRAAEEHYDKAIKGLEQIANSEKGALDTQTAATLQKNLAVIDQAISESRAAVRMQPTNEPAQQSLLENFKAKLALLQDTVALINEMRKGNEAGAARIGSGLSRGRS
jgi:anti-sigma factor ChrR (cupin superfamily)